MGSFAPLTAGITYNAAAGAGAAGLGGLAGAAGPVGAIAAALGYAFSPTMRKWVNKGVKGLAGASPFLNGMGGGTLGKAGGLLGGLLGVRNDGEQGGGQIYSALQKGFNLRDRLKGKPQQDQNVNLRMPPGGLLGFIPGGMGPLHQAYRPSAPTLPMNDLDPRLQGYGGGY